MKQITIGIFASRADAEKALNHVHNELNIPDEDLSFIYRNTEGEVKEVDSMDVTTSTPAEGAVTGASIGGALGALAGIAAVAGVFPVLGPLFVAGPLATALGLTGAVGATAAGALTGAAAGGVLGALASMGVGKEQAQEYVDRVQAGNILVAANAPKDVDVVSVFKNCGAIETEIYALRV